MAPEIGSVISIIVDAALWTTVLPVIAGLIRFRNARYGLRALVILAIVAFIADNIQFVYGNTELVSLYTPRVYTFVEFLLISLFFLSNTSRHYFRATIIAMLFVFTVVAIADYKINGLTQRDDMAIAVEAITLVLYSVATLYFIMKDAVYPNILATAQFWIISGILIYFGGNIFVFITSNYISATWRDWFIILWGLHAVLCMIFYSLMAIGLWKAKESQ